MLILLFFFRFRVLYDNVISLVYDTYTSHVKHQVEIVDNFEEKLVASGWLPKSKDFERCLHK